MSCQQINGKIGGGHQNIDFGQKRSLTVPLTNAELKIKTSEKFADSYELFEKEVLGEGRFGKVCRCQDKNSKVDRAAKCIKLKNDSARKDVEREVTIMSKMRHRFIAQLYDAFATSSKDIILIMELIQGGELFLRVIDDDFNMTESSVALIIYQVCDAVEYIHGQNIIHLDLNPQNLMLVFRDSIQIKLIDFGIAQFYNGAQELKCMVGTPEFCAPEVLKYEPLSHHTDMWSIGVIAYLLLSGVSPFYADKDDQILIKASLGKWEFVEEFNELSIEARDFVSKLLIVDKDERMLPVDCLVHPWLIGYREKFEAKSNETVNLKKVYWDSMDSEKQLDTGNLKKYMRNKKFRKSVLVVIIANKFKDALETARTVVKRKLSLRSQPKDEPCTSGRMCISSADVRYVSASELRFQHKEHEARASFSTQAPVRETCFLAVKTTSELELSRSSSSMGSNFSIKF